MSDNSGGGRSLGEILYSGGVKESPQGPAPGVITGTPAPTMREAPAGPRSLAEIMYSQPLDAGIQTAKDVIDSGKAREPGSTMSSVRYTATGPTTDPATTQAEASPEPAAGAEPTQPTAIDAEMMAAFTDTAESMGLGEHERQDLLALHERALQQAMHSAQARDHAEWKRAAEAHYGSRLTPTINNLRARILAGPAGAQFMQVMRASGLGSHPAVLRTLEFLTSGRR